MKRALQTGDRVLLRATLLTASERHAPLYYTAECALGAHDALVLVPDDPLLPVREVGAGDAELVGMVE